MEDKIEIWQFKAKDEASWEESTILLEYETVMRGAYFIALRLSEEHHKEIRFNSKGSLQGQYCLVGQGFELSYADIKEII